MPYPSWLRVKPGKKFDVTKIDPRDARDPKGKKIDREEAFQIYQENTIALQDLQFKMNAENKHKILIVLQAMDTAGKDGTIRKTIGPLNPQGVRVTSFKQPTATELAHDYLWRIHQHTPSTGHIQVFNRSHYEDVLVVRVHNIVPEERWRKRYEHIRNFEKLLTDEGTIVLKFMLHISLDEQKERLQARLDDPERHWKFTKSDISERKLWPDYMDAYNEMFRETSTKNAPWFVIPADRKWYRDYVFSSILRTVMEELDPQWPDAEEGLENIVIE